MKSLTKLVSQVIIVLAGLLCISASGAEFANFGQYRVNLGNARVVALGDFDGDGILDLVVAGDGAVIFWPGNGDGTFGASIQTATEDAATSVAVADFNGDGKLDLAVVGNSKEWVVLLGNGDGTFTPETYATTQLTAWIASGDFRNDGVSDLATANSTGSRNQKGGTVAVELNKGDGTFPTVASYLVGPTPTSIVVGDFNGDLIPDLVVGTVSNSVGVLLGNGDGTFQPAIATKIGSSPSFVTVADINNDGKLDLVTTLIGATGQNDKVVVALGNGNGTFGSPITATSAPTLEGTTVADVNKDGFLDLIVSNSTAGTGNLEVFLGNGNGTFQAPQKYGAGPDGAYASAVGDLNGDGYPDIVALGFGKAVVFLNNGAQ